MIKFLKIENFQSHKNTSLRFDPGFNVIVGRSDGGKSAILRALEWVRTNRPPGIEFIRKGETDVRVQLNIGNFKIIRKRTDKKTGTYQVKNQKASEIYSSFGSGVPDDVTNAFGMGDINFQFQLDKHFLLLDTPGAVAGVLNNITKLGNITEALTWLRKSRVEEMKNLEGMVKESADLEYPISEEVEKMLNDATRKSSKLFVLENERDSITERYSDVKFILAKVSRLPKKKDIADYPNIMSDMLGLEGNVKRLADLQSKQDEVFAILSKLDLHKTMRIELIEEKKEIEVEGKAILSRLKDCPYCGSVLNLDTKGRLVKDEE